MSKTLNHNKSKLPPLLPTPPSQPLNQTPKYKRMTPIEMEIRKEKGLCYTCDDKWSFKHQCPNKHLMILQVEEDGIELEQPEPHDVIEPTAEEEQMELHLSINAFKGACVLGTIRFI